VLSPGDIKRVESLAGGSDLYAGGHVGADSRSVDGTFETLTVRCCGRRETVVLVTSGNATFESGPRRQLLELLYKWRQDLPQQAEKQRR
jgi:hypothetical protein